jgi:hypothetical protein
VKLIRVSLQKESLPEMRINPFGNVFRDNIAIWRSKCEIEIQSGIP